MLAYLKSDVSLLADVFEAHRKMTLENYGLDAAHYMTLPSLAWDAAIKMKDEDNVERKAAGKAAIVLENMTDYDMHLFSERGKRGGITMIANREATADNKYIRAMDSATDQRPLWERAAEGEEREGDNYILYLDANNLYGKAMSMKLPTGGYRWGGEEMLDVEKIKAFDAEGDEGCFVEVDCDPLPEHLHDLHNDYPMACEKLLIKKEMVCPFTTKIFAASERKEDKTEKLVPNLMGRRTTSVTSRTFSTTSLMVWL